MVLKADKIIAVEYKLSNWKRALIQAFKYKNFAHASYVILDKDFHHRAIRNIDTFKRSRVGLGYVDEKGNVIIEYDPGISKPFSDKSFEKINLLFEKQSV
ncbi:hypothetical protein ODU73_002186 [Thermoclostridium stercorarium]|uniref:hypothetical protein n=1 Tax=Thermoclostridium stercorarium TaxID=1510 RepID=UPI0022498725|nr:hypothetical protein [Thermoclostridium stercorarium]UZQ85084.1 hypothetical protein ODU73_002186 [Thermoclostridium stercorarium]